MKKFSLLFIVLAVGSIGAQAQVSFGNPVIPYPQITPGIFTVNDFDHNGLKDIALAKTGGLIIYYNQGSGIFYFVQISTKVGTVKKKFLKRAK